MRRLAAVAVLAALLGSSCAAPGPPVPVPGAVVDRGREDDTARGGAFTVAVTSGDSYFSPTFIKAVPGARVTLGITNVGVVAHTFTIDGQHVDAVLGKKGDRATVTVAVPDSGPLFFYCKYHQASGMQGALYAR